MAIQETLVHVLFLAQHLNNCDPQCVIITALLELGIPTKRSGFDLLKKAILVSYRRPDFTIHEVFCEIGKYYEAEPSFEQIDQAIRAAITDAWKYRDENVWQCYFPQVMAQGIRKPSNAEFITQLARLVELWAGCRKEPVYER